LGCRARGAGRIGKGRPIAWVRPPWVVSRPAQISPACVPCRGAGVARWRQLDSFLRFRPVSRAFRSAAGPAPGTSSFWIKRLPAIPPRRRCLPAGFF